MALIQCTKKLLDALPKASNLIDKISNQGSLLGNWHARLLLIDRRKCILFTNDATLFSFLVPNLLKADLQNIQSIFLDQLIANLHNENLDQYIETIKQDYQNNLQLTTSSNRSTISSMTKICYILYFTIESHQKVNGIDILELNKKINRYPLKTPTSARNYEYAIECLQRKLENLTNNL